MITVRAVTIGANREARVPIGSRLLRFDLEDGKVVAYFSCPNGTMDTTRRFRFVKTDEEFDGDGCYYRGTLTHGAKTVHIFEGG